MEVCSCTGYGCRMKFVNEPCLAELVRTGLNTLYYVVPDLSSTYLLVESHLKLLGILLDSYLSCMYRSTARARARCMHGTGSSTIKYVDLDLGSRLVVPDSLPALPYL